MDGAAEYTSGAAENTEYVGSIFVALQNAVGTAARFCNGLSTITFRKANCKGNTATDFGFRTDDVGRRRFL